MISYPKPARQRYLASLGDSFETPTSSPFHTPVTTRPTSPTFIYDEGTEHQIFRRPPYVGQAVHSAASSRTCLMDGQLSGISTPESIRPPLDPHSVGSTTTLLGSSTSTFIPKNLNETDSIYKEKKAPSLHFNTFEKKHEDKDYTIDIVNLNDDVELLKPWKRLLYRFSPLFTLLAVVAYFFYYGYRIQCTLIAQRAYKKIYVMAWLFISAEGCVACPALLHQLYQMLSIRGRARPKLRIRGEDVPTVDVFITCCGEDVDVVLDTTRAACAVDWPQDRLRVVVLDDAMDGALEKACDDLREENPNLFYHARIKIQGVPHHFKAGNLAGGTDFTTRLENGPGEFIAPLDADMIPEQDWLRAIVPHLVRADKMALVCPPQLFYNVPDNDPLVQSLDTFVHVMEPTKDANGVAWCTGSGYIIRRSALNSIGGWPVGSLAEDTYTSSLLLGSGWSTAFCHEGLQYGTVPDTFSGHLKQRTRWTLGTLQTALKLKFCLFGKMVQGMSFFARLSAFVFAIDAFFKVFLLFALLTIPIVLISGGQLVAYTNNSELRNQIRLCFASLVLTRINEWITYLPSGYRLAQRDTGAQLWMAPFHAMTIIRSFILPYWMGGKAMAFSSSGSVKSELNERYPKLRAPLFTRLKFMLWDCDVFLHLLYVIFTITAVTYSSVRGIIDSDTIHTLLIYLLTHAFWPPMLWLLCVTACCEPIKYAIWPPSMPDREELLDRNPKTGIARPKEHWKKQRYGRGTFWHEMQYTGVTAFTSVVFFGAFFV